MSSQQKNETFTITQKTKGRFPNLPFADIKQAVLGRRYNLSLVFVENSFSKKINTHYRGKNKPTNVLAFPISKTEGELFINLPLVKKEAPMFSLPFPSFLLFIFIHGLLHLKGLRHGSRMGKEEKKWMKKYSLG